MLKLIKYTFAHFSILQSWVTDPDLLFQFAGTDFSFPLTIDQIINYQESRPDRSFYVCLNEQDNPVAFGEIIPQQNNIPRLGRLLVGGAESRGKGLGVSFIKLLIEECRRLYNPPSIELYVLNDNIQAIKCYLKCGFDFMPQESLTLLHNGKQLLASKMSIHIKTSS